MEEQLFNFLMEIPQAVANMTSWLTSPISEKYLNISPLGLFGVAGTTLIITLIVVHIVRLFV